MNKHSHLRICSPDLSRDLDLTDDEVRAVLDLAADLKKSPEHYLRAMAGKSIGMLFEKPSLRTRMTFDLAMSQMGGSSVFQEGPIGVREPLKDIARNLDRWVNAIVARVFSQQTVEDLAEWSSVPVINALSDAYHPCQALADVLTVRERFGSFEGLKIAFVGDGNNVAHSLMLTSLRLGMDFSLACPEGYHPNPDVVAQAEGLAEVSGARLFIGPEPAEAVSGAHAVYTDVWASMGQEQEAMERRKAFHAYQVNDALMAQAIQNAIFLHCLPAKRGEEVTDSVMESGQSAVFEQAGNRLHAQKALLLMMLA